MSKILIAFMLLIFPFYLIAQDKIQTRYYRDVEMKHKTKEKKASYKFISMQEGSLRQAKLIDISTKETIWCKLYKDNKLFGKTVLYKKGDSKQDSIIYGKTRPQDFYLYDLANEKLQEGIKGEFTIPKIILKSSLHEVISIDRYDIAKWILFHVDYPLISQLNSVEGSVKIQFTIDESGIVDNVRIIKGVDIDLDFASYKVLSSIPKLQAGKLNGKAIKLYVEFPISFSVQ